VYECDSFSPVVSRCDNKRLITISVRLFCRRHGPCGTSDIQSAVLLNSMSIREASYLRFHLCPFGNSYLTARARKIGPKSNINHLDAPIKLSWGMMLVGKD
jgi:hypothetical protein